MIRILSLALLIVVSISFSTHAAGFVVISSSTPAYKAGQQISADSTVDIPAKKSLVVINALGKTIHLKGPYKDKLEKEGKAGDSKAMLALASLIKTADEDSSSVGAIRAASLKDRDQAMSINISETGDYCLLPNSQYLLDRYKVEKYVSVAMVDISNSEQVQFDWQPAGTKNKWPEGLVVTDGARFLVVQEGKDSKTLVTLHMLEDKTYNDSDLLVALAEKECMDQARGMLAIIRKEAVKQ